MSRVGGNAQTVRQKRLSSTLFKTLARYKQAEEFSHFGSSLSKDAQIDLTLGRQIYAALQQSAMERHTLVAQQLMLETILLGGGETEIDVAGLKEAAEKEAPKVKKEEDFDAVEKALLKKFAEKKKEVPAAEETSPADAPDETSAEAPKEEAPHNAKA